MNDYQRPDPREAAQEITISQAAKLLETTKQTIRNHMEPQDAIRRQRNGQTWIFLSVGTVERIRAELGAAGTEKVPKSEPQTTEKLTGKFTGKSPVNTEKLPVNDRKGTENHQLIDQQAEEIQWLRAQVEELTRQLAAKDHQIAAAQQLANQAQALQLMAEKRLAAHVAQEAQDPAQEQPDPQTMGNVTQEPEAPRRRWWARLFRR